MADLFAGLGRSLDVVLGRLGLSGAGRFDAALYLLAGAILLWLLLAVPPVIRTAQLRGSRRKPPRRAIDRGCGASFPAHIEFRRCFDI